jgi:hypothetical protein
MVNMPYRPSKRGGSLTRVDKEHNGPEIPHTVLTSGPTSYPTPTCVTVHERRG